MSTTTPNLGLILPEGTDPASIDVLNSDFTLLDGKFPGAAGTIQAGQIEDLTITGSKIANLTIGAGKMAADAWTAFTPTLAQSAAITLTGVTARYLTLGKLVIVQAEMTANSAGTAANNMLLGSLPVAGAGRNPIGIGDFVDASAPLHYVLVPIWSGANVAFVAHGGTSTFGANPAVTIAASDVLRVLLAYEAA